MNTKQFKSIISLLIVLLSFQTGLAQYQIPGSGFDTFENSKLYGSGWGYDPIGWYGANVKRTVLGITAGAEMVSPENNGRTGKCVYIHNEKVEAAGIGAMAPAWISLGVPWNDLNGTSQSSATAGTDGGISFSYRPDTLAVWVKRTYSSQEDANIVYYSWSGTSYATQYRNQGGGCSSFSHYDEESDIRQLTDANACGTTTLANQIGEGSWRSTSQYTSWTEIKVPITYYNDNVPTKMNVIISAGNYPNFRANTGVNAGSKLWADDLRLIYSSKIHELRINNRALSGFNQNTLTYTYALGQGVTTIPTITAKRSGRLLSSSEMTIHNGVVDGAPTTVTVTAEDGSSTTTYTIYFVSQQSTNARPSSILVNGTAITGFNAYITSYNIELPYGTTTCPTVTVTKAETAQTYTISTCSGVPGSTTVTVYAADGTTTQTYTLNFTVGSLTDNTLQNILVNGSSLTGFSPTKNNYTVELPLGTTVDPTVQAVSAYTAGLQIITVTNNGLAGGATITVTPNGTTLTRTYRLTFVVSASSYSYLADLKIGGTTVTGFDPQTLLYSDTLAIGTTVLPTITWTPGDAYQTITKEENGIDGITRITVTAQNGTVSIYRISFTTLKSSVNTLNDILLNGVSLPGFNATQTSYSVVLPIGTTTLPEITWISGDIYQTVTPSYGGVSGNTRLVVKAQDNSTKTYTISFSVAQANVSTLLDIQIGGVSLTNFDPNVTTYNYLLPRGTTVLPAITYTVYDAYQTIRKIEGGVNGATSITVKAQTGATTVYTINFSVDKSTISTLSDIQIGGVSLAGFDPNRFTYNYLLPSGTTSLPAIVAVKGDAFQANPIISKGGISGTTIIRSIAENGDFKEYAIVFSVEKNENASLLNILLDNIPLPGFAPDVLNYTYVLPLTATTCPNITVEKSAGQTVNIMAPQLIGTARIEVQPEEGSSNIYTIKFTFPQQTNAQLAQLVVNGTPVNNFDPSVLTYDYVLPSGTTTLPTITYTTGDASQIVYVSPGGLNGITTISVMAENGSVVEYTINFSVAKSNNALLADLKVANLSVANYRSDSLNYAYTLADNSLICPEITAVKGHEGQTISMQTPSLEGQASIIVTSEDGLVTNTYTIDLAFMVRTNTALTDIKLNGNSLTGFNSDVLTYTETITAEETNTIITYTKADSTQTVHVNATNLSSCELIVVAQNGDSRTYNINYNILPSNNPLLADLQLYNTQTNQFESIAGFAPTTYNYVQTLGWRTRSVPTINPVATNPKQVITIWYEGINDATVIRVVAEDGTTQDYTIEFPVEKSSINTLSNLYVDGTPVTGFNPIVNSYTVTLPYGTTTVPDITWHVGVTEGKDVYEQQVILTAPNINAPAQVQVIAEDGSSKTYTLTFKIAETDKSNILQTIIVNGVPVGNTTTNTTFDITLPYGTTTLPTIEYIKNFPEQTVLVSQGAVNGITTITVYSNKTNETMPIVYTLNMQVNTNSSVLLSDIKVNGTTIANFSPTKTSYIVNVTDVPTMSAGVENGLQYEERINNNKHYQVVAFDPSSSEETVYDVYFYYTNDVIPNATFDNWTTAKYNSGAKPTGWQVPADGAEKYSVTATYKTGPEVNNSSNSVRLRTWSSHYSIYGGIPGLMTLGNLSLTLASSNGSTMSITGGISYRNTPDGVQMAYKPVSKTGNVNNMKFTYILSDGTSSVSKVFTDGTFNNTQKTMNLNVISNIQNPTTLNLIINSAHSENPGDIGFTGAGLNFTAGMKQESDLYVDDLAFTHSSNLSGISVNGIALSGITNSVKAYAYQLDAEYQGIPHINVTGEVPDQAYDISITNEVNRVRTAIINVTAENGTTSQYSVSLTRNASTNKSLLNLLVNGVAVAGFDPTTLTYTVTVPNGTTRTPDVTVVKGNTNQTITYTRNGANSITIQVTAENGTSQNYVINFVKAQSHVTTLQNITVEDAAINYDAATFEYEVTSTAYTTLPTITFEKMSDGQTVILTTGDTTRLVVIAENGTDSAIYNILFTTPEVITNARLASIEVSEIPLNGFNKVPGNYTYNLAKNEVVTINYAREFAANDSLITVIYADSLIWYVSNATIDNRYQLEFVKTPSTNANLANIIATLRDTGDTLDLHFNPELTDYTLALNRYQSAEIEPILAEVGQTLAMAYDNNSQTLTITVTAPDSITQKTTVITFSQNPLTSGLLERIEINEELIKQNAVTFTSNLDFANTVQTYNVMLRAASPKWYDAVMPTIWAKGSEYGQTISITTTGVKSGETRTSNIIVTSESGSNEVYSVNLEVEKSTYAYLNDLAVNYESLIDFAVNKFDYNVTLTTKETPVISFQRGDAYQTITSEVYADSAVIHVVAEDGTIAHYVISFTKNLSSNALLSDILLDGTSLTGFNSSTTNYNVELPVGTTTLPEIKIITGDAGQTSTIETGGTHGTTIITVIAENGTDTVIYSINFTVLKSTNNVLSMIYVAGDSLNLTSEKFIADAAFDENRYDYYVKLPVGTRQLPIVSFEKGDTYQTATGAYQSNTYVIQVNAEDQAVAQNTYRVTFEILLSDNAFLNDISLNGETLTTDTVAGFTSDKAFNSQEFEYHIDFIIGSTTLPTLSFIAGDTLQTVEIIKTATTLNDTVIIKVTSESDTIINYYKLYYNLLLSENSYLSDLVVFNETLPFEPTVFEYNIVLPVGTTELPNIEWIVGDIYQTIDTVTQGVNGDYIITVTAQNGNTSTYTIHFTVRLSNNAYLANLLADGTSIPGFDNERFNYVITLPYGTTEIPVITYEKAEESQLVSITAAQTLADTTFVTVTAEDGVTIHTYAISFIVKKSDNALLENIFLNGDSISLQDSQFKSDKNFESEEFYYNIRLPYGTTELPEITWIGQVADYKSISLALGNLPGTSVITVVSEDESNINDYNLTFSIEKSNNTHLLDLLIDGTTIEGFNPDTTYYTLVFPVGTDSTALPTADDITYTLAEPGQTATVSQPEPTIIVVTIVAEDGTTVGVYVIESKILLSNNSLLKDIKLNGISLKDFESTIFDYTFLLLPGTALPEIEAIKFEEVQEVYITANPIGEITYIYVVAQDGSESTYTILFKYSDDNPGIAPSQDDVCWSHIGNGTFKASTIRNNVKVAIFDTAGRLINMKDVPLVDPNDEICNASAAGALFNFDRSGKVFIYVFYYNQKAIITQGKFMY